MEIKIEKGVPVGGETRGRKPTYPFAKMEIGDSIFVEGVAAGRSAVASAHAYAAESVATVAVPEPECWRSIGRKQFTSRKEADGVRIWRTEDRPFDKEEIVKIDGVSWVVK